MKARWLPLIFVALLGLLLCTCSGDNKAPAPTSVPTAIPTPIYPDCDPALLMPPQLVSPGEDEMVGSLTPMFEWASPGYVIENDFGTG